MDMSASVVMTVYNGRDFLAEQIESVMRELGPVDELIIVDDASTDGAVELAEFSPYPQVRVLRNPKNLGVVASFDRGLAQARNEVIFLCDQDDVWLPGKRAAYMAEFACSEDISVVVSDAELIDREGHVISSSFMADKGGFKSGFAATLWRNRFLGCAMAVRRSLLRVALPIPRSVPMHDMWLGVLGTLLARVVYLPTPYVQYRRHGGNVTPLRSKTPWRRRLLWRLTLLRLVIWRLWRARWAMIGRHSTSTTES